MRLVASLVMVALMAGCLHDPQEGKGAAYVSSEVSGAEVARIAWRYATYTESFELRLGAQLTGEVPIEHGAFDLQALIDAIGTFEPPMRACESMLPYGRPDAPEWDAQNPVTVAFGSIVATASGTGDDLTDQELADAVVAEAKDVAILWTQNDVARDSYDGRQLESAVDAGVHLARLRPCRVPVDCQGVEDVQDVWDARGDRDQCVDPWPGDGVVLLEAVPNR